MTTWSYARIWSEIARVAPDRTALVCGPRRLSYGEFDARAGRLAQVLAAAGLKAGDQVAIQLVNSPEYMEACHAALQLGCAPVNVNYRYVDEEIAYVLDNSDARALVYHDDFGPAVAAALERVGQPPLVVLEVRHRGTAGTVPGARDYEDALATAPELEVDHVPSGDDLVLLYTGGTTGRPKGVMWRTEDLYRALWESSRPGKPLTDPVTAVQAGKRAVTTLPACPLIHGTGFFASLSTLSGGGTLVLLDEPRLDPVAVWDAVDREEVGQLMIVGDAFARPLLSALESHPGRWALSSLKAITSSGVMWSPETKRGLLEQMPHVVLVDSMGASEGLMSRSMASRETETISSARFERSDRITVLRDDGTRVSAGSGEVGMLAVGGAIPLGYYKDPEKSAMTFREVDGRRWSVPGDYATVEPDGTIRLLGRGSQCINTGGEKVFPEEVDEIVKAHPAVFDCVTVGVPDDRWGEMVVALVQPRPGAEVGPEELDAFCRRRMAGYKRPKEFVLLEDLHRAPSGKADYPRLRTLAAERLARGDVTATP